MMTRFLVQVKGTHTEDDPRPFDAAVASFLKALGPIGMDVEYQAVSFDLDRTVEAVAPEEPEATPVATPEAEPEDDAPSFASMTKAALYEVAQDVGLPGRSKMTKDDLIEALQAL